MINLNDCKISPLFSPNNFQCAELGNDLETFVTIKYPNSFCLKTAVKHLPGDQNNKEKVPLIPKVKQLFFVSHDLEPFIP